MKSQNEDNRIIKREQPSKSTFHQQYSNVEDQRWWSTLHQHKINQNCQLCGMSITIALTDSDLWVKKNWSVDILAPLAVPGPGPPPHVSVISNEFIPVHNLIMSYKQNTSGTAWPTYS